MTLKDSIKRHSSTIKTTAVVVGAAGAVAGLSVLGLKLADRTVMLNAAMDVIKDQGGDATKLVAEKVATNIAKTIVN